MTFELYTDAVLTSDIPSYHLCRGDVVKVIDYHAVPDGEDGYSTAFRTTARCIDRKRICAPG